MRKFLRNISGKKFLSYLVPAILLYFVFHSIYGERGLISYFSVSGKIAQKRSELDSLRKNRIELEHRLDLLKSGDRDLIDEEARRNLGLSRQEEKILKAEEK